MQPSPKRFLAHLALSAVLASLFVMSAARVTAAAQERPDFTGEWILDLASSQLHADFRVLESGVIRLDHREPAFVFRRVYVVKGKPSEVSYEVTTDGREHRVVGPNGGVTIASMRWDHTALVIHQRISDPKAGELTNRVRYELMDNGRTLRATEDFEGAGRAHHNVWIFRRP